MTLITGIVGIVMLLGFLGILVWWIQALPFTLIVVGVVSMALWDLARTLRSGNG